MSLDNNIAWCHLRRETFLKKDVHYHLWDGIHARLSAVDFSKGSRRFAESHLANTPMLNFPIQTRFVITRLPLSHSFSASLSFPLLLSLDISVFPYLSFSVCLSLCLSPSLSISDTHIHAHTLSFPMLAYGRCSPNYVKPSHYLRFPGCELSIFSSTSTSSWKFIHSFIGKKFKAFLQLTNFIFMLTRGFENCH